MSITFHPKVNELARSRQVAEQAGNAFLTNWIISGLDLSVPGSGRNVPVSSGKAFINGYIVDLVSMTLQVPDNATSTVYLGADVDGQNNVNHFELSHDIPSSGLYVVLGQVVVSGGNITSVNETGRSVEDRLIRTANIQDSAITTGKIDNSAVTDIKIASDAVTTAKIQNDAVTLAKIQDINTQRILGRNTAGSGNIEELTPAEAINVLAIPLPQTALKIFDQSVLNSTVLVDDNKLNLILDANSTYYIYGYIYITDGAGDYKYQISVPSDAQNNLLINDSAVNSGNTSSGLIENEIFDYSINTERTKTTPGFIFIRGMIKTVTGGNLVLRFAQSTANNTTAAITKRGSFIQATKTTDTFTQVIYSTEYLAIAGGGGGGATSYGGAGGGGAGGYLTGNTNIVLIDSYTVTVGAGGVRATSNSAYPTNGSNSVYSSITTIGGGAGGSSGYSNAGINGGSGGGAASPIGAAGGAGTTGQGNNGGSSFYGSTMLAGGGGGAGSAGVNGNSGSHGGNGLSSSINGTATTRAGGGGGGRNAAPAATGGAGGGGAGGMITSGTSAGGNGTTNTGGGGGGGGGTLAWCIGGNGGSGIVIIKYPDSISCNVGAGLTSSETTSGGFKIRTFTAGTGTISFS